MGVTALASSVIVVLLRQPGCSRRECVAAARRFLTLQWGRIRIGSGFRDAFARAGRHWREGQGGVRRLLVYVRGRGLVGGQVGVRARLVRGCARSWLRLGIRDGGSLVNVDNLVKLGTVGSLVTGG